MESLPSTPSPDFGNSPSVPFRGLLADALRFWEPRRLVYNLILSIVTVFWVVKTWPHFRPALTLTSLFPLSILALIANAFYSAAYFLDIPMQSSSLGLSRNRFRWGLWLLGMLFAMLLTTYWILDEIYPDFH
jgi:hypothetical protein